MIRLAQLSSFFQRSALLLFGLLLAIALVELGLRVTYDYLPLPVQNMIRHVRVWGSDGSKLGPSWLELCVGDSFLSARNLPNLEQH